MPRDRLALLILPFAALIAVIPLIFHGCSCGHDFDFHVLNWMEAAHQFTQGNLHPHWAFTAAYNAGEPRFVFYPPISWTVGAFLGLILPWVWTPVVYTWLALTASGLALYYLARDFTTPTAALLAATFYAVNPYMLFTAYERTAYAELLAAAWIPLLLHAILRKQISIPRIAIPVALLWLTNAPAAVMACYTLALLAILRLGRQILRARKAERLTAPDSRYVPAHSPGDPILASVLPDAARILAGTALGLGLSAFYLVPAAYERRYVQIAMAILPNMRIQDNFLFHHTGDIDHDIVLHTASVIALILLALTSVVLGTILLQRQTSRTANLPVFALVVQTVAIALLLTPLTAIVWNHLPELAFLQFPWRLLAILAAVLGLTAALALSPWRIQAASTAALAIVTAAALTYPAYVRFHQSCDEEDTVQARQTLFHSNQGTDPTDEYTPVTADNDALSHANTGFWLASEPNAKAPINATPGPSPNHLTIHTSSPQNLILNLRDYPAWHIRLNKKLMATREQRDDGLIAIPVPEGSSTISITYAQLSDQTIGTLISAISIAILILILRLKSPPERENPSQ
jgi:hypothetical protein